MFFCDAKVTKKSVENKVKPEVFAFTRAVVLINVDMSCKIRPIVFVTISRQECKIVFWMM